MNRHWLGTFERQVLLAVLHLAGTGYAVSISTDLTERFGRPVSLGAIYATLDRLEKKGLVSSRLGDPTPERGGKPKRFYAIEAAGQRALTDAMEADQKIWSATNPLGAPA